MDPDRSVKWGNVLSHLSPSFFIHVQRTRKLSLGFMRTALQLNIGHCHGFEHVATAR